MGCGASTPGVDSAKLLAQKKLAAKLDTLQKKKEEADSHILKLLILGAGESGKSTLFKQLNSLYGSGFNEEERKMYKPIIAANAISAIKVLLRAPDKLAGYVSECELNPALNETKTFLLALSDDFSDGNTAPAIIDKVEAVWKDPGIQICWAHRSKLQVMEFAGYFLDNLRTITAPEYIPTESDIMKTRIRTTGIFQTKFTMNGITFHLFDVGGQRNERKKWIHCFENVAGLLFVAAISEYDQRLWEDETVSRVDEAVNLFEEVSNSPWFKESAIVLFLNKKDLLLQKMKTTPLSRLYPEYTGGDEPEKAFEFFTKKFQGAFHDPTKQVYTHVTCATDRNNIELVFKSVKDSILRKSFTRVGIF